MFQLQQLSFLTFLTISRWKESLFKIIKVEIIENSLSASHLLFLVPQEGVTAISGCPSLLLGHLFFFRMWTGSLIIFFLVVFVLFKALEKSQDGKNPFM